MARFNQLMGLLIVVSAVGAIVWLTLVARTTCTDPDLGFVAYVPGVVELRSDTRVEFYEQCVGRISTIEPGVTALQLEIERRGQVGEREIYCCRHACPVSSARRSRIILFDRYR